jgi:hypothetical protein
VRMAVLFDLLGSGADLVASSITSETGARQ